MNNTERDGCWNANRTEVLRFNHNKRKWYDSSALIKKSTRQTSRTVSESLNEFNTSGEKTKMAIGPNTIIPYFRFFPVRKFQFHFFLQK